MKIKAGLSAALVAGTLGAVCFTHVAAQRPLDPVPAVSDATLERPADGDWLMWRRTLDGWGYSPLQQITRQNVGALKLAWQHDMATTGIQEATPARVSRHDVRAESV